jgi:acyl-CoA synthetase (AMP-forming)/AMP-acid ligase II
VSNWNYGAVWERIAEVFPTRPAIIQAGNEITWEVFHRRAGGFAHALLTTGLGRQAKLGQYMYNCPQYLESLFACFMAGLVPVNTNYRYGSDELVHLWNDADVEAVVFHGTFSDRVDEIRTRVPRVRTWWWVQDDDGRCPQWAIPYERAASSGSFLRDQKYSGDDLLILYTGGTTGVPKGVMWRQDDLFCVLNRTTGTGYSEHGTLDDIPFVLEKSSKRPVRRTLMAPPLMHASALTSSLSVLSSAGCVILPSSRQLDIAGLLDLVESERVTELLIVGDSFARPIVEALDGEPSRWNLSSLWLVFSSGAMWSAEAKQGLLRHLPELTLVDALGSSEAMGVARSTSRVNHTESTARFALGPDTKVLGEGGFEVQAGTGSIGRLAIRGRSPLGYYKDPRKSAETFMTLDGERWTIPGDFATVRDDGSVQLLGRGSVCITTGGEKVFPEEVEEALKLHPDVADAAVVGLPDDRLGESVTALVELTTAIFDEATLIRWVKSTLAGYKAPRRVVRVASIGRGPSGKLDYNELRSRATDVVKDLLRESNDAS